MGCDQVLDTARIVFTKKNFKLLLLRTVSNHISECYTKGLF